MRVVLRALYWRIRREASSSEFRRHRCVIPSHQCIQRSYDRLTFMVKSVLKFRDPGAVAICVGIDFGAISRLTRLADHAARSIA
jgi:hypothetical protein